MKGRIGGRDKDQSVDQSVIYQFAPQKATKATAVLGQRQEPRAAAWSPRVRDLITWAISASLPCESETEQPGMKAAPQRHISMTGGAFTPTPHCSLEKLLFGTT